MSKEYSTMAAMLDTTLHGSNDKEKFLELKKAHHKKILKIHPDKNPHSYEEATRETQKINEKWKEFIEWNQKNSTNHNSKFLKYTAGIVVGTPTIAVGISTLGISLITKVSAVTALACVGKVLTCAAIAIGTAAGLTGTAALAIGTGGLGLIAIGAICLIAYGVHKLKKNMDNSSSNDKSNETTQKTSEQSIFSKFNSFVFANKEIAENKNLKNNSAITLCIS